MMRCLYGLFVLFAVGFPGSLGQGNGDYRYPFWDNDGRPLNWSGFCEVSKVQSPIDLSLDNVQRRQFEPLEFRKFDSPQFNVKMSNNGHGLQLTGFSEDMELTGGPLGDQIYALHKVDFHWPSEHTFESNNYPLEAQFVFRNEHYVDFDAALGWENGIVVLSIFHSFSNKMHYEISKIQATMGAVLAASMINKEVVLGNPVIVENFWPDTRHYFTYFGSFTTPPCSEPVRWIVFLEKAQMQEKQMHYFKDMEFAEKRNIEQNNRDIQEIHERDVFYTEGVQAYVDEIAEWGYPDPSEEFSHWGGLCDLGRLQSPLDLRISAAAWVDIPPLRFRNYDRENCGVQIVNNGHTVELFDFAYDVGIGGGPLKEDYVLEKILFHWPSEHCLDGAGDPLEIQLMHRSKNYSTIKEALHFQDGIVIISVLHTISTTENNPAVDVVTQHIDSVKAKATIKQPVRLTSPLIVKDFFTDSSQYFWYPGSLTSPPCTETVRWIVLAKKMPVRPEYVQKFFDMEDTEGKKMEYNSRKIQPRHVRIVMYTRKVVDHLKGGRQSAAISLKIVKPQAILLLELIVLILGRGFNVWKNHSV